MASESPLQFSQAFYEDSSSDDEDFQDDDGASSEEGDSTGDEDERLEEFDVVARPLVFSPTAK